MPNSLGAEPECVLAARALCGEAPVWDTERSALWWVDIQGRTIHCTRWPDCSDQAWPAPGRPSCLVLQIDSGVVVAVERTLFAFYPPSGWFIPLAECDEEAPDHRFNDGRCDRRGRLWIGTLPEALDRPSGGMLRYEPEGRRFQRVFGGLTVPNGLGFSWDGATMFHADSRVRTIWRRFLDAAGQPGLPHVFATFEEDEGRPDGAAVDAEGFYWIAHITGGRLTRFAPDGRRDRVIPMPVSRPTMCAFGGLDMDILFITSGTEHLSAAKLAEEPFAGGLFAFRPGVHGLLEPRLA